MLEQQFLKLNAEDQDSDIVSPTPAPTALAALDVIPPMSTAGVSKSKPEIFTGDIRRLHANLESRLQPFWSTALAARKIKIQLFTTLPPEERTEDHVPIMVQEVLTGADGFFSAKLTVSWEEICRHPGAAHIVFGDHAKECDMHFEVELLPSSLPGQPIVTGEPGPIDSSIREVYNVLERDFTLFRRPSVTSTLSTPLTDTPIRVISDIDDTIKLSNILRGARTVFRNVFVKELNETMIPGMGQWYHNMWKRGVCFHYVVSTSRSMIERTWDANSEYSRTVHTNYFP
jgi:hypothetical protein